MMKTSANYGTVKLQNSSSVAMNVFVKDPDGQEHFITTLQPGQSAVQFTPLGATWIARPEAQAIEHVASTESSVFLIEAADDEFEDDLIDRGMGSTST